jgi:hypothetical protein
MNSIRLAAFASALSATLTVFPAAAQQTDAGPRQRPISALQLSLWDSVQTSDPAHSVYGMRLNLPYGRNSEVRGFDLGIANHNTRDMSGLQLGFGSYVERDLRGMQSNLILSVTRGEASGYQQGIYTYAGRLYGVQAGAVNHVHRSAHGARFAAVNISETYTEGAELGLVNYSRRVRGLQLGLVNVTNELHGVQIGLANIAKNGFLPFFPVVNAAM